MSVPAQALPAALQQSFAAAFQHHKRGSLTEAERLYREVLRQDPRHADSLHLLGVLMSQSGSHEEAAVLLGAAIELVCDSPTAHTNLGSTLRALGRLEEACLCYRRALALKPDSIDAHNGLGNVLLDLGRVEEAVTCYGRLIELEPDCADAHYNLANAQLSAGHRHEAVAAYRRALRIRPQFVEAHNNLGVALTELGIAQEALGVFDHAAGLCQPGFEDPLANKAALLLEAGQLTAALQAADQALAVNPGSAGAWHIRSGLKQFTPGDPDIVAMQAALHAIRESVTGAATGRRLTDRIRLELALGKAWMDVGDAQQAFDYLERGNRLHRSTFSYDSDATGSWIAEMAEAFDARRMQQLEGSGHPSGAGSFMPVFVVGMPRSGTTLVEQVLASHSEVHGAGELTLLEDMVGRVYGATDGTRPTGDPHRLAALSPGELDQLGQEYERNVRDLAPQRQCVVDKMPTNFLYLGFINAILPNARIIHCRRNALDTCLSCYTKLFRDVRFASDLRELGRYYRGYETLMRHWRTVLAPDRFIEVYYEDVVQDLETEARRLVEFCGLPWQPACLSFYANRRPIRTASVSQVRKPIYRSSVGRWKPYAHRLRPLLEALGPEIVADAAK